MSEVDTTAEARPESVYTVQVERPFKEPGPDGPAVAWVDIATVTVPSRAHRRGVVAKALADAGIKPGDGAPPRVRVLDARSAEVFEPEAHQPEPEWRLV